MILTFPSAKICSISQWSHTIRRVRVTDAVTQSCFRSPLKPLNSWICGTRGVETGTVIDFLSDSLIPFGIVAASH